MADRVPDQQLLALDPNPSLAPCERGEHPVPRQPEGALTVRNLLELVLERGDLLVHRPYLRCPVPVLGTKRDTPNLQLGQSPRGRIHAELNRRI